MKLPSQTGKEREKEREKLQNSSKSLMVQERSAKIAFNFL